MGTPVVGRVPARGPPGRRRPGGARGRPRWARRHPVRQPRRVAPGGPGDALERERDRARLPDELRGPDRPHPRSLRGDRLLRGHPRPAGQAHGGARPAAGTQAADPRRGRPAGRGLVRARLRRSARRRHQPPGAAPRSRLRARPQRPARGPRHDRLHEWCLRTPQGGHALACEPHVDAAQRDPRLRHPRGRTPVVVPAPQPHRRADDGRVPAHRRRRRDLVRPRSGHGRRGPGDVPAHGAARRPPRLGEAPRDRGAAPAGRGAPGSPRCAGLCGPGTAQGLLRTVRHAHAQGRPGAVPEP